MILKFGMKHLGMQLFKIYANHDPLMTLTYFTSRSTQVAYMYVFEWEEMGKMSFNSGKLAGNRKMDRRFMFI